MLHHGAKDSVYRFVNAVLLISLAMSDVHSDEAEAAQLWAITVKVKDVNIYEAVYKTLFRLELLALLGRGSAKVDMVGYPSKVLPGVHWFEDFHKGLIGR